MKTALDILIDDNIGLDFAEKLFTVASGFSVGHRDKWWPDVKVTRAIIAYQQLDGYALDKHFFIELQGSTRYRAAQLLAFIYPYSISTPIACDNVWLILPRELKEVTDSSFVATTHDILKKCMRSITEQELCRLVCGCCVELSEDGAVKPAALAAATILFGAHRLGLGARQIAAQALAWEIWNSGGELKGLYSSLLASLVVDTYIWFAGMCAVKEAGTIRGELYYALLAGELRRLAKWVKENFGDLPRAIDEVKCALSRRFVDAQDLASLKKVINDVIEEVMGLGGGGFHELLLGLLADRVLPRLDYLRGLVSGEADVAIVMTEQVGPGFLKFVKNRLEDLGVECRRILVFYTMYTYLNRLMTSWYLGDRGDEVDYRLISASDPEYSFNMALKAFEESANRGCPIILLALGPMSSLTPLFKAAARIQERGGEVEVILL